jgi:hypothetical protein
VCTVDKRLGEIEFPTIAKVLCERSQDLHEDALAHPLLQPSVARLMRRILAGQRPPRRARPEHPQDRVEHSASCDARSPFAVGATLLGNQRRYDVPLLVGKFHIDV